MQSAEELRDLLCIQVYGKPFAELVPPEGYVLGEFELTDNSDNVFLASNLDVQRAHNFNKAIPRIRLHNAPKPRTLTLDDGKGNVKTVEIPEGERVIAFVTDGWRRKVSEGDIFIDELGRIGKWCMGESCVQYQPVRKLDLE